jgi:parallel beta-helix repeat protein
MQQGETMKTLTIPLRQPALWISVLTMLSISACGGGGGKGGGSSTVAPSSPAVNDPNNVSSPPALPPAGLAFPDTSRPFLNLPATIADGSTVLLECGRVYQGTLNVRSKSNVTVTTSGSCGPAVITPGRAVTGWNRHSGNIYSAPLSFEAAQVVIDGRPVNKAHWPSRSQVWARATSASGSNLSYAMPNVDLAGATLLFRPSVWAIEARTITGYAGNTFSLASTGNYAFDGYQLNGQVPFYVEGKLWMLDEPGEWAVRNGRLYVWAPDGGSPEGRIWAFPAAHGIDATDSRNVSIEGVRVYGAANGIHALGAQNLRVTGVDIANASENGIVNHGGVGLMVDRATIRNVRHDAITVHWGGGKEVIQNSRIDDAGTIGMPTNSRAAINLVQTSGSRVSGNHIANAGYIGIRIHREAAALNNKVDGACIVLTDCGGVFAFARDKLPLNTRIEGNIIRNIGPTQRLAWGIYLSEYANAVTVAGNTVSNVGNGMNLFNNFNNSITNNTFSNSRQAHIEITEDSNTPVVRGLSVMGNTFASTQGEETYRNSSNLGATSVAQFGAYDANTYVSSSSVFANFQGQILNFTQWQQRTGQDQSSTFRAP